MTVLSTQTAGLNPSYHCEEGFPELLEKIHMEAGWDFRHYKKTSLKRRISLRLNAHNISSYTDYNSVLESNPQEYTRLLSTITIKVSEFFREPKVFDLLRELITPLFSSDEGLRAWSCACAHGEEAYSLGILLADSFGEEKLGNVRIFATDIDEGAIDIAGKGVYREESLKNLSDGLRKKYFLSSDRGHKVDPNIRHLVKFGRLDVVKDAPISKVDIIFCRNLLIYFEKELQNRVLEKLDYALKPGGILVLGRAETLPPSLSYRYKEVREKSRAYRRLS